MFPGHDENIPPWYHTHTSFKVFNHEVKEPRDVQRTLANTCIGVSCSGRNQRNNILKANELPASTVHQVAFRARIHHGTVNLGGGRVMKPDIQHQVRRSARPCPAVATFSVTPCCAHHRIPPADSEFYGV